MLERIKEIVAESLGTEAGTLTTQMKSQQRLLLRKISVLIHWIFLKWLWLWKRNLMWRFLQKTWKESRQSEMWKLISRTGKSKRQY